MTPALQPVICTANVTHGSTVVQVVGVALSALNCALGANVALGRAAYFVGSDGPTDTTHFNLETAYEGSTDTVSCSIGQVTPEMTQRIALQRSIATYNASAQLIAANQAGLSYQYSASLALPNSGQVSLNDATPADATVIRFAPTDLSGQDISDRLDRITNGDEITIRAIDGSARITYVASADAATTAGIYYAVVNYVGTSGLLAAGAQVVVERIAKGAPGVFSAIATEAEAQAGTDNTKGITPLRAAQAVQQRFSVGDTYINVKDHYGIIGSNDSGDNAKFQTALDTAPYGNILFVPRDSYSFTTPLTMSKPRSLKVDPDATLTGTFSSTSLDLLAIGITDLSDGDAARNMLIEGGKWINNGGNCAININPSESGYVPHFGTQIRNALITGGLRGVRIGGADSEGDTNFCTVEGCNLTVSASGGAIVDLDGCGDGQRILHNLIFGDSTGIRANLVAGAFNTQIEANGIVSRDGALLVADGSKINFIYNQCEQQGGVNGLIPKSTVLIQGLTRIAADILIWGNNFGGGPNVDHNITMYNARGVLIDKNQFNPAAADDIYFGDGGSGAAAKYNAIGPNNWARGTRSVLTGALTDITRRLILSEDAACVGNRGFWKPSSELTFANSWVAGDDGLDFMETLDGQVRFEGSAKGGTTTLGTTVFTLPEGYRPRILAHPVIVCDDGSQHYVQISSTGEVSSGAGIPASPNNVLHMSAASFPANYLSSYDAGP